MPMLISLFWFGLCALQALISDGGFISVYDLPKILIVCVGVSLLVVFLGLSRRRVELSLSAFGVVLGTLVLIAVNASFSSNPLRSFWGDNIYNDSFLMFGLYLVLFLLVSTDTLFFDTVLRGINLLGLLVALGGLVHAFLLYVLKLDIVSYDGRITGTIGQPNILGGILVSVLPVSFFLLIKSKSLLAKVFYFLSTVCILVCLIITMSRGAYLAFIVIILLEVLVRLKKIKQRLALLVSLAVLCIGFFAVPKDMIAGKKSPYLVRRFFSFRDGNKLYDMRFEIWRNSLRLIAQRPLAGWGNSTFQEVYQTILTPENAPQTVFKEVETSHNLVVDMLVEWGVPFTLIILMLLGWLLKISHAPRLIKYAFIAVFVRSLININSVTIWFLMVCYLGLLVKAVDGRRLALRGLALMGFWVVMISVSFGASYFMLRIGKAEVLEKKLLTEGDPSLVEAYYKQALGLHPYKQSLWGNYLAFLSWRGDSGRFKAVADQMGLNFDDYRLNFYSGLMAMREGDANRAVDAFLKAHSLNTRDPKTTHYLGQLYYNLARYDEAEWAFVYTVNLDTKNFNDDYIYLCDIELRRGNYKQARKYMEQAPDSWRKDQYDNLMRGL